MYIRFILKRNIPLLISLAVIQVLLISLCSIFFSISKYDKDQAISNSTESLNLTFLKVEYYKDAAGKKDYTEDGSAYKEIDDGFIQDVENKIDNNELSLSKGYNFEYPFSRINNHLFVENSSIIDCTSFNKLVTVDSFHVLKDKLIYGSLPKNENEVLIYDFAAEGLINTGVFPKDSKTESLIGKRMTFFEKYDLVISGIIKSSYKQIIKDYKEHFFDYYDFRPDYLDDLKVIVAYEQILNYGFKEENILPIDYSYFVNYVDGIKNIMRNAGYIKYVENLNDFELISGQEINEYEDYLYMSQEQFSELFNIPINEINGDVINEVFSDSGIVWNNIGSDSIFMEKNYNSVNNSPFHYDFLVYEKCLNNNLSNFLESTFSYVYLVESIDESPIEDFLSISDVFLTLGSDKKINDKYLKIFSEVYREDNFVDIYDYAIYSPVDTIIREADRFMIGVKDVFGIIFLILLGVSLLFSLFFSNYIIKEHLYSIGLMKIMGYRNKPILFYFFAVFGIILGISLLLSLPVSSIIFVEINKIFSKTVGFPLSFFSLSFVSYLISFGFSVLSIGFSLILVTTRILRTSPKDILLSSSVKS
jgi:hypothetical protein